MIANATAGKVSPCTIGVCINEQQDKPNDSIKPGETWLLIPLPQPEIKFTVPIRINVWQGNGS